MVSESKRFIATSGAAMLARNYYQPTLIPKLKQRESYFLNSIRLMRSYPAFQPRATMGHEYAR